MKTIYAACLVASLAVLIGCGDSGKPGGPGVKPGKDKDTSNITGPSEETFTLDMPNFATKLKQGESKTVSISLDRGKNFDESVTLSFDNLPKGVTIDPAKPEIKASDKEAKITLKAADDAALGDFTINVTGHPAKGEDATNELKITVAEK